MCNIWSVWPDVVEAFPHTNVCQNRFSTPGIWYWMHELSVAYTSWISYINVCFFMSTCARNHDVTILKIHISCTSKHPNSPAHALILLTGWCTLRNGRTVCCVYEAWMKRFRTYQARCSLAPFDVKLIAFLHKPVMFAHLWDWDFLCSLDVFIIRSVLVIPLCLHVFLVYSSSKASRHHIFAMRLFAAENPFVLSGDKRPCVHLSIHKHAT